MIAVLEIKYTLLYFSGHQTRSKDVYEYNYHCFYSEFFYTFHLYGKSHYYDDHIKKK